MTQVSAHAPHKGSRLVRTLSDLVDSGIELSHKNFADKLGRLIDLSDSITLSEALRGLSRLQFEKSEVADDPKDVFLQARAEIMEFIIRSFVPGAMALPFSLPKPSEDLLSDEAEAFQPYQKFYAVHQSEMEHRVYKLRVQTRQLVSSHSLELAQLSALDAALGDTLAPHTRKVFAAVPRLLGKRFERLRHEHRRAAADADTEDRPEQWVQPGGWLALFYQEIQGLLLAELEVRLQPVLGLLEALDTEEKQAL